MEKPTIELVVKSASEEDSGKGRLEHGRRDIFGAISRNVLSLCPFFVRKNNPRDDGSREEEQTEWFADEDFLRKKAEVHCPLVREDAREFEGFCQVLNWVRRQERKPEEKLNGSADGEEPDPIRNRKGCDHDAEESRRHQQDVHFDGNGEREPDTTEAPAFLHEVINRDVSEEHRKTVVETTENENGVNALRQQQQDTERFRKTRDSENFHNDR